MSDQDMTDVEAVQLASAFVAHGVPAMVHRQVEDGAAVVDVYLPGTVDWQRPHRLFRVATREQALAALRSLYEVARK